MGGGEACWHAPASYVSSVTSRPFRWSATQLFQKKLADMQTEIPAATAFQPPLRAGR